MIFDFYILGVVSYNLCFKKLPFNRNSINIQVDIKNKNYSQDFDDRISKPLQNLIKIMLSYEKSKRKTWINYFETYYSDLKDDERY